MPYLCGLWRFANAYIYYNKEDNDCYYIDVNGMTCHVNHKNMWDDMTDEDWETPGFE